MIATEATAAPDLELLRQHRAGSQDAFADLVARHLDMVYSAALRQVRRHDLADDVTQAVFLLLSQKAASLSDRTILPAWLYRAAGYCSANALRGERNRARHERRAAELAGEQMSTQGVSHDDAEEWAKLSGLLDKAIATLPATDRSVVILRYLQGQTHEAVARDLGMTPDTARKRVDRAVLKLRRIIARLQPGGVLPSVLPGMASLLAAHAIQRAPAHLLSNITPSCSTAAAAATTGTPAAMIAKGASNMMIWTNIKTAALAALVVLVLTAGALSTVLAVENQPATPAKQPMADEPKDPRGGLELIAKSIREGNVEVLKAHVQADTPGQKLVADNQARTCASVVNFRKAYGAAYGKSALAKLPAMVGPVSVPPSAKFTQSDQDNATADFGSGQTLALIRQDGVWKLAYESLGVAALPMKPEDLAAYLDRTLAAMDDVTAGITNHEFPTAKDALAALTKRTREAGKTPAAKPPTTEPEGL